MAGKGGGAERGAAEEINPYTWDADTPARGWYAQGILLSNTLNSGIGLDLRPDIRTAFRKLQSFACVPDMHREIPFFHSTYLSANNLFGALHPQVTSLTSSNPRILQTSAISQIILGKKDLLI
jgi:hypothetical protein